MLNLIDKATEFLKGAKSLFLLTGAGISAESGIPTFRGVDGLWKNYSAIDLATPEAFERNPQLVWEWYHWRQGIIVKAQPNPAHFAVAELEKRSDRFLLLTQNVDNLHQRAGSKRVLELHGNIFRARCTTCRRVVEYGRSENSTVRHDEESELVEEHEAISRHTKIQDGIIRKDNTKFREEPKEQSYELPRCDCGSLLRPDVVWFGEQIPQDAWQSSLEFLTTTDVALILGTSGVVWPAAAIPEIAQQNGAITIEVNLEATPITSLVDVSIQGKAGEILPQIVEKLSDNTV